MQQKWMEWWKSKWVAYGMALLFTAVIFWFTSRQYTTYNLRAPDVATFTQAIWNTLHGRFLHSTIISRSILSYHFSPFLALLAPLLLIWPDARVLFLAQTVGLAAAGLFLYKIVRQKHAAIAPWFLLAFYLNPALHEVALQELRRVIFAVPFLALAFYALYMKKRPLMLLGLGLALLCKEDISIVVFMVGIYLLFFERDWKWGAALAVLGVAWALVIPNYVIPALGPPNADSYPQLNYFDTWGSSPGEIMANIVGHPLATLQHIFDQDGLRAVWRVFLPVGLVLPFLAPGWLLVGLPSLGLLLLSSRHEMHRLEDWYMAPVLPALFAAVAVALTRFSAVRARWLAAVLLGTALLGFGLFSHLPPGGKSNIDRYKMNDHHRLAAEVIATIPANARVAAQDAFLAHLAQRQHIYLFPWIKIGRENIDYFILDRHSRAYPYDWLEIGYEIDNMVAEPAYVVEAEVDGIYLLHNGGDPLPAFAVNRVAEEAIKLARVEVAPQDARGFYRTTVTEPVTLKAGQELRVTLYWEALDAPQAERTVSVRVATESGALVAQQDMQPSHGARPTSWWQPGWAFRDVYYLTIAPDAAPGPATLDVLLYDTYSLERVPFANNREVLHLADMIITP